MPSPCMPSRRVVSYRWICANCGVPFESGDGMRRRAQRAALAARRRGNSPTASTAPSGAFGASPGPTVEPLEVLLGSPLIASTNLAWIARVISPAASPSAWSSISRTGTISAAVPVRKTSSARYSSPRAMSRSTTSIAEVARDLDHRLAVDPVEDRRGRAAAWRCRRRARRRCSRPSPRRRCRARRAGSPRRSRPWRLDLREDRVQVLAAGLGLRDEASRAMRRHEETLERMPLLLALLAEVGAPRPDGDRPRRPGRSSGNRPISP